MSWGLAWLGGGLCAVLVAGVPALLRAQGVASAQSDAPPPEVVVPGELVIEPPTLINLGFEWFIQGDKNRNASVDVAYRRYGAAG